MAVCATCPTLQPAIAPAPITAPAASAPSFAEPRLERDFESG
jgi:hypothetical protein